MLRYGDGTPFPLTENVLPVIADTVTTCTTMFEAAAELDRVRAQARQARDEIELEERRLFALEQSLIEATTVRGGTGERPTATKRAAQKALAAGKRAVRESRQQLTRAASARGTEPRWEVFAERVHHAAAAFFARHNLPHTQWTWYWDASGTKPVAGAEGHSASFAARFDLPLDPLWQAPVRVGVLVSGLVIPLYRHRTLRKPQLAKVPLDNCLLVYAARDAETRVLLMREHATSTTSWRITIPPHGPAIATSVDRRGRAASPDVELAASDVRRLWSALETEVLAMLRGRRVREVLLDGRPLTAVRDITAAPRSLLDYLGPLIAEIRRRSRVVGELSLKRDVGEGVREELFIPRVDITARYARLPADYRALLDAAGLGRGVTSVLEHMPQSVVLPLPANPVRVTEAPSVAMAALPRPPVVEEPSFAATMPRAHAITEPSFATTLPHAPAANDEASLSTTLPAAPLRTMPRAPRATPLLPPLTPVPLAKVLPLRPTSVSGLITPAPVPLAKLPRLPRLPGVAPAAAAPERPTPPPLPPRARPVSKVPLFDHGKVDFRKLRM